MKIKKNISLLFFIVVLAVAFFTNPKKEAHLDTLKTKLTEVINESMTERQQDVITYNAWKLAGNQLVDAFARNYVSVDNYYVFSLTRLHWNNESYIIGVGAFGKVYITRRLNKELIAPIISEIEQKIKDFIPDFLKQLQ